MSKKRTKYQQVVTILALLFLIGTCLFLIIYWPHIPSRIPGHYDGAGKITRLDPKWTIFFLPILALVFYLFFAVIEKNPALWSLPREVTPKNKTYLDGITKDLIVTMKLLVVSIFCYLTINNAFAKDLSPYFLPVVVGFLFLATLIYLIRSLLFKKL